MTIDTIELIMDFVKLQSGDCMLEILPIPTYMTRFTVGIEPGDLLSGRMTGPTRQIGVVSAWLPPRGGVNKCRLFFSIVAFCTLISLVAS